VQPVFKASSVKIVKGGIFDGGGNCQVVLVQIRDDPIVKFRHGDNRRTVKQLESAKKKLETKLEMLSAGEKKDNTLTFEELGIDRLFVDEAHYFKNLFYISKMTRIAGLPQTSSERAFDMLLKTRYIQEINGGGGVVFATGTPIANSVAEMFTMQRYLQTGTLRKQQLQHFDFHPMIQRVIKRLPD
jgi:N12 class adenine-specific DNA methylase